MKHAVDAQRRRRRAQGPAAGVGAIAALLALLAACSGSAGSPRSAAAITASASAPSAVAYSTCIRSHGVPNFPDPPSSGQVPKASPELLGISSAQLQAAEIACQHLYPSNGASAAVLTKDSLGQCEQTGDCPQALVQAAMTALRRYAVCVRSHGLPAWPDPTLDAEQRPGFDLLHVTGFDPNSPQTGNVMQECYHVLPGGVPVPVIAPGGPG